MKAILLARFSPRSDSATCQSCDTQLDSMRDWCAKFGHEIAGEFREDALSGDTAETRPILTEAIDSCRRGMILVCRDFQRVSRNARFLMYIAADLASRGVSLYSLTEGKYEHEDDELWLSFGVRALFGEYMRRKTKKRTKSQMLKHQKGDGKKARRMSKELRYGWRLDNDGPKNDAGVPTLTVADEAERDIIARIMDDYAQPGASLRTLAKSLTAEGVLCRGRPWKIETLRRIISRERAEDLAAG